MDEQLERIRKAYDLTVEQYDKDIDPLEKVPLEFRQSPEFKAFIDECKNCNSGASENKAWLEPRQGMRFLDAGCCAGLASYRLDRWPSLYFGVDISPRLIQAMKGFVSRENISIGGLYEAEISNLPFEDNFFDIAAVIGVFEYLDISYITRALGELERVLKSGARAVLDIPNQSNRHYPTMIKLEEYLRRPQIPFSRKAFEESLNPLFETDHIDDSQVMLKYFVSVKNFG